MTTDIATDAAARTITAHPSCSPLLIRMTRLLSSAGRAGMARTVLLSSAAGLIEGAALVSLMPASSALASGEPWWGLRLPGWLIVVGVLAVVAAVVQYVLAIVGYRVALDLMTTCGRLLGEQVARAPLGWFRGSIAGTLARMVSSQMLRLGESLAHMFAPVVTNAVAVLVLTAGAFIWDWRLGSALLVAVPVYAVLLVAATRILDHGRQLLEPVEEELSDRIVEFARCQGALRSCGCGADYPELRRANEESRQVGARNLWWGALANALHGAMTQIVVVTLIVLTGRLALGAALGPLQTIAFIGICLRFTQSLDAMSSQLLGLEERRAMMDGVDAVLDVAPLPEPPQSATQPTPGTIELIGVRFGYDPAVPVLQGIDIRVPARSTCALVGPSGSGKTTIARLVARFWDVDSGEVRVGGTDVRELTTEDLMRQLSMVFQDVYLFDDTLEANIRVGNPQAGDAEVRRAAEAAGVGEIVDRLPHGWQTRVGEGGRALSGGERQRVSVARALLKQAPIVLLDEATSSLDPENESHVVASLEELRARSTMLVIAHKLDTIRSADQIIVLGPDGRVAQRGTHDELVEQEGQYRRFWEERSRAAAWQLA